MASVLNEAYFHDEAAAFKALEEILWPNGPVCPLCGNCDAAKIGVLEGVRSKPSKKHPQGVERLGLHKNAMPAVVNLPSARARCLKPAA